MLSAGAWMLFGSVTATLLIWLGYPAAMWALASLGRSRWPKRSPLPAPLPLVSVVVATRETPAAVDARVRDLLATAYDTARLEVIVAKDATARDVDYASLRAIAPNVRLVDGDEGGGKAATLNAGVRDARGDLLVFADTSQRFDRNTIPALVAALGDPRFAAVSGSLELGGRGTPVHWYWAMEKWLRHNEARWHSAIGVTGAVYAARRTTWVQLPAGTLLDDVYAPMSMVLRGHRVGFVPEARATDVRTFDSSAERDRKARTLTGVMQLCRQLPDVVHPLRNPAWSQFVAHKLLRLLTPLLVGMGFVGGALVLLSLAIRAPLVALAAVVLLAVALAAVAPLRRLAVQGARWLFAMQQAGFMALRRGFAGRWDVWGKRTGP